MDSEAYFGQLSQASGDELAAVLEATQQQEQQLLGLLAGAQGILGTAKAHRARMVTIVGTLEGRLSSMEEAVTKVEEERQQKEAARENQLQQSLNLLDF